MFTTGNHFYLYIAAGLYAVALLLYCFRAPRVSFPIFFAGFIINILYLIGRGWLGGVFLLNPIVEGPFLLPCCIALVALLRRAGGDEDWGLVLIPTILFALFSLWHAKGIIPPTPQKITLWAVGFFITEVSAHACFYCGAFLGLIDLLRKRNGVSFHPYIVWGFVLFSISQIVGAVWAYLGWGNTFSWGPRHMTTAGIWVMYAAYLHLRFMPEWGVKRRAVFAVIAGCILLFFSLDHYIHEMNFPRIGG
jgi:ABC-type transport system involved in cytochrome c biogenesis permease subunit